MGSKKVTLKGFILKSRRHHGMQYDYSESVYTANRKPITIKCPTHGYFTLNSAENHYAPRSPSGCPECNIERREVNIYDTRSFISKAKKIHDNRYNYSRALYKGGNEEITIVCLKHGVFNTIAWEHLEGNKGGCPQCKNYVVMGVKLRGDISDIIGNVSLETMYYMKYTTFTSYRKALIDNKYDSVIQAEVMLSHRLLASEGYKNYYLQLMGLYYHLQLSGLLDTTITEKELSEVV